MPNEQSEAVHGEITRCTQGLSLRLSPESHTTATRTGQRHSSKDAPQNALGTWKACVIEKNGSALPAGEGPCLYPGDQ